MSFDFAAFLAGLQNSLIIQGVITTIWLTLVAMLIGVALGLVLALMKVYGRGPLPHFANFYIWIFRGTPILIQLVIIYAGLPQLGIRFTVVQAAIIGFGLNEAAYMAENIRAGLQAVPKGQVEAARALGIKPLGVIRHVVLPQAIRVAIPASGNSFILLMKGTSQASVISMAELMRNATTVANQNFKVLELFMAAAIYYLVLTSAWGVVQRKLERRFGRESAGPMIVKGPRTQRPKRKEVVE